MPAGQQQATPRLLTCSASASWPRCCCCSCSGRVQRRFGTSPQAAGQAHLLLRGPQWSIGATPWRTSLDRLSSKQLVRVPALSCVLFARWPSWC